MNPDRCPACADLTAPCAACFARDVARLCDEMQPATDALKLIDHCDALMRPQPRHATTASTDTETLRLLGLDDASTDAAMATALDELRAEGHDPDAVLRRAGEVLTAWRDNPYALATEAPR